MARTGDDSENPLRGLDDALEGEAIELQGRFVAQSVREALFGVPAKPITVGRYRLGPEVGRGAMGVVHEAYDDKLERKVAIKFIDADVQTPDTKLRMLREAQAMAKLSHPNVVSVFDEGEHDERVYIAMEFVDGPTLRAWLKEERPERDVLTCLRAAGRGLAAAHRAGIVHRDFKPDNVLVGADDVPKVADFGLVGVDVESTVPPSGGSPTRLTQTGARVGTALYMAPEQHRGEVATAASDQFAFCVCLFEALHGMHPFREREAGTVLDAIERGDLPSKTPRRPSIAVRRIVERGLRPDPTQRHASMDALLDALDRTLRPARVGWWIGGAAVVLAGSAWAMREPPCEGVADGLQEVWNDSVRARLADTLPHAQGDPTLANINKVVDDYGAKWSRVRTEACMATHRGTQSEEVLDLRMRCLDDHLTDLRVSLEVIAQTQADQVADVVDVATGLPPLEECANVESLEAAQPGDPAPQFAEDSKALREGVSRFRAQLRGEREAQARALAKDLAAQAQRIGDERAHAEILAWMGWVESQDETFESARRTLANAYYTAGGVGLDAMSVSIACDLANLEAQEGGLHIAEDWHRRAEMAIQRGHLSGTPTAAYYEHSVGVRLDVAGDHEAAAQRFTRSLDLFREADSPDYARISSVHRSLGMALSAQGRREEAREHLDRALELRRDMYGEAHYSTITARITRGELDYREARFEDAVEQLEIALHHAQRVLGPTHVRVADLCNNLSGPLLSLERTASAIEYLERARDIYAALPEQEDDLAMVAYNLGNLLDAEDRHDEAKASYERAAASWTKLRGATHPYTLRARVGAAASRAALGDAKQAQALLEDLLPLFDLERDGPALVAEIHGVMAKVSFEAEDDARANQAIDAGLDLAAQDPSGSKEVTAMLQALRAEHPR